MATILSGILMLRHLGEREAADSAEAALAEVVKENQCVTYDLKPDRTGGVGTSEMADAIIRAMKVPV
jgi:isocitrate dehydrogenase (NAD+)